ncbi:MAG: Cof-type HAD-IIB family hydrolase [Lactobacillus sp.]|nr:Cof-type HAD-IIB family hydrolase [Lactobacillus sp.]
MKIIFSDIDGTLINDSLKITPKTKQLILKQIKNGNLFVPVSARSPLAMKTVVDQLGDVACPIAAFNGALILDEKGNEIYSKVLPIEEAKTIIREIATVKEVTWNVYSGLKWLTKKPKTADLINEENIVGLKAYAVDLTEVERLTEAHKTLVIGQPEILDKLMKTYQKRYPELSLVKSKDTLLEIVAKGVDKGDSVKRVAEYYRVPLADTIAFGDNYNDETMLKMANKGYLMANAPEALKASWPLITADHNHDGIAEVLEKVE